MHTYVSKNAIMFKDTIFYLLLYNVICWSSHIIQKKPSFPFNSFIFLVNNTGEEIP